MTWTFLNHWLLTILIFLPTAGAVLVLLAKGRDAVRWTALGTTIVTFLLSLLLLTTFDWHAGNGYGYLNTDGHRRRRADGSARLVDPGLQHRIPRRHRRALSAAGSALHVHLRAGVHCVLEHREDDQGLHGPVPVPGNRHPRRVSLARLFPVLRLLRSQPAADVLPDRHLGRAPQGICGDQVLPLHVGWFDRFADRTHRHVSLQPADRARRDV